MEKIRYKLDGIIIILGIIAIFMVLIFVNTSCSKEIIEQPINTNDTICWECKFTLEYRSTLIVNDIPNYSWETRYADSIYCNWTDNNAIIFEQERYIDEVDYKVNVECNKQ